MLENLTSREREIFNLLLEGVSAKEIAHKLNISYSAVDFHRSNLYRKLGVHKIQELLAKFGKAAPSGPKAEIPVFGAKKIKRYELLLSVGITLLAFSVLIMWIFFKKPSAAPPAAPAPKGVIIPARSLGFIPWTDANDKIGDSTAEVYVTREEIDGVIIDDVLNIKTNLAKGDKVYAEATTTRYDLIQQLRKANGIRFKARGDGKSWYVAFYTLESTSERNWASYHYAFGTVRDKVIVVDIPYSLLFLPVWYEHSFDFNKETIKNMIITANPSIQEFGSASLQIFDFEVY